MATDPELNLADSDSQEVWAPIHAWRTLGQLRAAAAVEPLLTILEQGDDYPDDWAMDELPGVFGMIGPAALPVLASVLADASRDEPVRQVVPPSLVAIMGEHPETRAECIAVLAQQLDKANRGEAELNGFVVAALLDVAGAEAAPAMERAFAAGAVDRSIAGGWDGVQYELGLTDEPPKEESGLIDWGTAAPWEGFPIPALPHPTPSKKAKDRAKARRKMAKQSRKRNRKKK
jgi:hypothetical protein